MENCFVFECVGCDLLVQDYLPSFCDIPYIQPDLQMCIEGSNWW